MATSVKESTRPGISDSELDIQTGPCRACVLAKFTGTGRVPHFGQGVRGPKKTGEAHDRFGQTRNDCWVPHLPRFTAEPCGVDTLHAPFLNERRTRGPL